MRHRKLVFALGEAATAWPFAGRGQSDPGVWQIGILMRLPRANEVLQ
jgi:hypothetical protein